MDDKQEKIKSLYEFKRHHERKILVLQDLTWFGLQLDLFLHCLMLRKTESKCLEKEKYCH